MFNGIRIFSSDHVWCQILRDLGADIVDVSGVGVLNFDDLQINAPVNVDQLRAIIFNAMDDSKIVMDIVGSDVRLSPLQHRIVAILHKSGGMSGADIKAALGYAPDITTHAVDTAIYGLRKMCGHDIIQNVNGIYKIGRI